MNPLMAMVVDQMIRRKDTKGLKRLLLEAMELQSRCKKKREYLYMEHIVLVIKKSINEAEN